MLYYRTECPGDEAVGGLGAGCGATSQRCAYTDNKGDNGVSLNREKRSNMWWRNRQEVEILHLVKPMDVRVK